MTIQENIVRLDTQTMVLKEIQYRYEKKNWRILGQKNDGQFGMLSEKLVNRKETLKAAKRANMKIVYYHANLQSIDGVFLSCDNVADFSYIDGIIDWNGKSDFDGTLLLPSKATQKEWEEFKKGNIPAHILSYNTDDMV